MQPRDIERKNTWYLLKSISRADFKIRFNDSVLGYLWYLLKPLMLFAVLLAVFSYVMRFQVEHYGLRLLIGIMLWDFFSSGSLIGIDSFFSKSALLTKVYFRREIILLSANITALLTLFFNMLVLLIFLLYEGFFPKPSWLAVILAILPMEMALLGVSFGLGALKLFYGDVLHIWEVVLQLGFWATPIIYPVSIVPPAYRRFIYLNPFACCIESSRNILIENRLPDPLVLGWAYVVSLLVFAIGYSMYRRREPVFAEVL